MDDHFVYITDFKIKTESNLDENLVIKKETNEDGHESSEALNATHESTRRRNIKNVLLHKKFQCPVCNYKAPCKCNYQRHRMSHLDPLDTAKFKCFFCSHRAKTLQFLRTHMFVHRDRLEDIKCFMCNVVCKSKTDLNDHMELHKTQDKLECVNCNYNTNNVKYLRMHAMMHKNTVAVHECCLCYYKCRNISDLSSHFLTHKESPDFDLFKCSFCDYRTKYLGGLRLHLSTHKDSVEIISCSLCENKFKTKGELAIHFLTHRKSSRLDSFECSFCNYSTRCLGDLRSHLLQHNMCVGDASEFCVCQYICPVCHYKTTDEQQFEIHLKSSHENCVYATACLENLKAGLKERPMFHCEKCDFKTFYKFSWKTHLKLNHLNCAESEYAPRAKDESVMHKCKECSYQAKFFAGLKRHQETHKNHSERRLYECTFCVSKYTTKCSLKQHVMQWHSDSGSQTKFQCEKCPFTTFYRYKLNMHIKKKHLGIAPEPNMKGNATVYQCNECSYQTSISSHMKLHIETHKDRSERHLYKCAMCVASYTSKKSLEDHILTCHTDPGNRPKFQCRDCEFTTFGRVQLKLHRKKNHLKKPPVQKTKEKLFKYKCNECSYQSNLVGNLKRHQQSHKDRSERQLYECATCSLKYTTKKSLAEHISEQHADPNNQVKLECYDCEFTAFSRLKMKSHRRKHLKIAPELKTKGKPVDCSYQNSSSSNMKRHEEIHKDLSGKQLNEYAAWLSTYTTEQSLKEHVFL